jgi:pyridoxamine 5'-phosphate oxidase-like protein
MVRMATWREFTAEAGELAAGVEARLRAHKHLVVATIRADGSPRVSGTEIRIFDGELYLAGMAGSRRGADLRRDPRLAIHSGSDDDQAWRGDAKLSGIAVEHTDPDELARFEGRLDQEPPGEFDLFSVRLTEATLVRLGEPADHLVISTWRPGKEVVSFRR